MSASMALDSTAARARELDASWVAALRVAWRATLASRLLLIAAGALAFVIWGLAGNTDGFDPGHVTHGFGSWGDPLSATFARWDSNWYLAIANDGYSPDASRAAFFPLYPLLVRGGHWLFGSPIAAGVVVSVLCLFGALVLLHRLTALELDAPAADATVWLLALFPFSFFLSAVYSESLYLLLSVGAVYSARTDRWAWAGSLGALAALTRSAGLVLLVPLALIYWQRRRRLDADALWLVGVPLGIGVFCLGLALAGLPAGAPFHAQDVWMRSFAGPFVGVWDGTVAAFDGIRQLLSGQRTQVYFPTAAGDPFSVARINLLLFGSLLLAVPAVVAVLRLLPLAYGAYVLAALALPLSYPVGPQPLMSLPRFELVLFPLFMWAGWAVSRPRFAGRAQLLGYALSAVALAVFAAQFATWHWVA
jgi:hypothetical protein